MTNNISIYQFNDCQITVALGCPGPGKDGCKLLRTCALLITIATGLLKITLARYWRFKVCKRLLLR